MSKKVLGVVDAVKHINPVSAGSSAVRAVASATADEKRCPKCGSWAKQDLTGTDVMGKACAGGATVGVWQQLVERQYRLVLQQGQP